MRRELLLGAGNQRVKAIWEPGHQAFENLTTVDLDPRCEPDLLWDLNNRPLPFPAGWFNEIHAYEVLEHIGRQGDWRAFFEEFSEYYRLLKPGGLFVFSVPRWDSPWAWGDPGHVRCINQATLTFLNQDEYVKQIGVTSMADYREWYRGNFRLVGSKLDDPHISAFALEKV